MATTPGTSAASTRARKPASISSLRDGVRSGAAKPGMAAPGISPAAATAAVRNNVSRRLNRTVIALPSTLWNLSAAGGKHSLQFQYRAVDRFDAGAERRTGEQDRVRSGAGRVATEPEEALGHRVGEPAVPRQIGRQAVVEQIHQAGFRPKPRKGGLDRHNRMFQGVDQ